MLEASETRVMSTRSRPSESTHHDAKFSSINSMATVNSILNGGGEEIDQELCKGKWGARSIL